MKKKHWYLLGGLAGGVFASGWIMGLLKKVGA